MKAHQLISLLALACAPPAFAQLNETMRKDIEASKPLPEVVAKAQAVAMASIKKTGTIEKTDPQLPKKPQTSQSLNDELANIETTWNAAGFSVRWNDGLVVQSVAAGSPADKAGLRPGARIKDVSGEIMAGMGDFVRRASGQTKGPVKLTLDDEKSAKKEFELTPPQDQKPPKDNLEFRAIDATELKKAEPAKERNTKAPPVPKKS